MDDRDFLNKFWFFEWKLLFKWDRGIRKYPGRIRMKILEKEFDHYIFIISQLWLTSHQRSIVVLLDTETPGTSREIYSEDADGETRTRNPWITNPVL